MDRTLRAQQTDTVTLTMTPRSQATAVGASYAFDPAADGIAGIYATRVIARGVDPRALCAELRGNRQVGVAAIDVVDRQRAAARTVRFGRGTSGHRQAPSSVPSTARPSVAVRATRFGRTSSPPAKGWGRRLAAAGLIALLLLPLGFVAANAQETPLQSRYIVQPGDTIEAVAAEFGVDPAAILAASAVQNPPYLTSGEIIIIPAPGETPEEAVATARQRVGTSPFVVGAHGVSQGETLAKIAGDYGLDAWSLAAFNGIGDLDSLAVGQRLRVPLTDSVVEPIVPAPDAPAEAVGGASPGWVSSVAAPVFAREVPAYQQMYSLSCEYAAAYIATSAFGYGVPESAFMERIGLSANPHWGYRGNIHGPWGGTDDYGIYPEALVPTLNEFGFVGDVFYSGGDPSALTARLDVGMPVITWLGYFGDTGWVQEDEGSYLLVPGMHVVTVYGYDDGGVYLANPGRGSYEHYAWGDFLAMWAVLDGMALAVAPM
jgi:uncharacterized protein YvpB/LysM repeat protein